MFDLTEEQKTIGKQLVSCIKNKQSCVLSGSAGTGKTTLVSEITKQLPSTQIIVSAPTHKALQVLREKIGGGGYIYKTIHSVLELKKFYNGSEVVFRPDPRYPVENKIIIVDEGSMVGDFLLGHIEESFNRNNIYLFLGDPKQLPPVNEDKSPIFTHGFPDFRLETIIRQADGNDIIDLSMNLGRLLSKKDGKNYSWRTLDQIIEKLAESNGSDDFKYLTWTNKTVNAVNQKVRNLIYGNPEQFEEGEVIRFNEAYRDLYQNSQEVKIVSVDMEKSEGYYVYRLNGNILCLADESKSKFKKDLKELYQDCDNRIRDWDEYHALREMFANVGYNHALTVHKSQGSTYDNAIINIAEIKRNPNKDEMNRMLYTAITRAKFHNYLL